MIKFDFACVLIAICFSCGTYTDNVRIDHVETEYDLNCAGSDSCIRLIKTYFSDGSLENAFFLEYPNVKTVTKYDPEGKFISEMQVLNDDSIFSSMLYDSKGNELEYKRDHMTKPIPNLTYEYKNVYDDNGKLSRQFEYDIEHKIKTTKTFYFDTLNVSRIIIEQNREGEKISVKIYKDSLLISEHLYRPHNYIREFAYNQQGLVISKDPQFEPQLRSYYTYTNGLPDKIVEKYRSWDGNTFGDASNGKIHSIIKFKYTFDDQNRPIKTLKSTFYGDNLAEERLIITEYF